MLESLSSKRNPHSEAEHELEQVLIQRPSSWLESIALTPPSTLNDVPVTRYGGGCLGGFSENHNLMVIIFSCCFLDARKGGVDVLSTQDMTYIHVYSEHALIHEQKSS